MVQETIFQHWIVTKFLLPFVLVWGLMYAILEKTKILGEGKQLNGIVSAVVGLIFVGAIYPKLVVENMILFLVVALVILFVILMIWGFVGGTKDGFELTGWMKNTLWAVGGVAVIIAVLWATGVNSTLIDLLFYRSWSGSFWTNFLFIVVVAGVLALVLKKKSGD